MPVQSIECQLTLAQVKRYLDGSDFPDEVLGDLERHLKACPACMVEANRLREALGGAPAEAVVELPTEGGRTSLVDRLTRRCRDLLSKRREAAATALDPPGTDRYRPSFFDLVRTPKNLVLSGSLALVLVLMSTVFRNPTQVLGSRASIQEQPNVKLTAQVADSRSLQPSDNGQQETAAARSSTEPNDAAAPPTASADPAKPSDKQPAKLPHVGGSVVVADSAPPSEPKTQPVQSTPHSKPPVKAAPAQSHRPPRRARKSGPKAHIHVYKP